MGSRLCCANWPSRPETRTQQYEALPLNGGELNPLILPQDLFVLDVFGGREAAKISYPGTCGHAWPPEQAECLRKSFTCIVCVRPDYSANQASTGNLVTRRPILFCAEPPPGRNRMFDLSINSCMPRMGFGYNTLASNERIPDDAWTCIVAVYDSTKGRRLLVNGRVVAEDDHVECWSGAGRLEVCGFVIPGQGACAYKGGLSGLALLRRALSNREIRELITMWGFQMTCTQVLQSCLADMQAAMSWQFNRIVVKLLGFVWPRKIAILGHRLAVALDVLTDLLLVIDNATAWKADLLVMTFNEDVNLSWAIIGFCLVVLPVLTEYMLMFRNATATLARYGVPFPCLLYIIFGLPSILVFKVWLLLAHPFSPGGHTPLSFLGAFEQTDFIVEATLESPWQALLSVNMLCYKARLGKSIRTSISILISLAFSLLALKASIGLVRDRQRKENIWRGSTAAPPLNFWQTIQLVFEAGMGLSYSGREQPLMDEAALLELKWVLTPPSTLAVLNLEGCRICNLQPICDALLINTSLAELMLGGNLIEDLSSLEAVLATNKTLKKLSIENNRIQDIAAIVSALMTNTTLRELRMHGNPIPSSMKEYFWANQRSHLQLTL